MTRRRIAAAVRSQVARAARFRCGYCLTSQRVIGPLLEIDHIVPEARGGTSQERNLWLACPLCNGHKADRVQALDPIGGTQVQLFNPRRDRWTDHFAWVEGGAVVVGVTPSGRATVAALQMNDPDIVTSSRRMARPASGTHPALIPRILLPVAHPGRRPGAPGGG